ERAICKPTFKALWTQLPQHIRSYRPRTDLCWQCQQNNDQLIRSANLPEERKTAAIKKQQDHLQLVQKERAVYDEMTAACKKINCLSAPPYLQVRSGCTTALTLHSRYLFHIALFFLIKYKHKTALMIHSFCLI
ncbi:hypothetical protein XENOCAPTIV_009197, partial [Xenoophorus captivus]